MASDESSGSRPAPVVLRIKLRYDDVDAMVHRFAPNIGKSGLFLPTRSMQAVGTEVKFELRLTTDAPVLVGLGRVKAARAPDPANPRAAFGIAIELMRVTPHSRDVILKMLERRKQLGLAEVGIPLPEDIEAARRSEVDTSVKVTAAPEAVPARDSAPVLSGPESAPMLTAPRRTTGPIAIAKASTVVGLAPEPPRRRRPAVQEVIERASGPIATALTSVPDLEEDVDVGAALARARALAGGNLDAELDALREAHAAPVEISIEAASAELARQLGGAAVLRDRSARWAPPPSTIVPAAELPAEPSAETPDEISAEPTPAQDSAAESTHLEPEPAAPQHLDDPGSAPIITEPITPSIPTPEPEPEPEPDAEPAGAAAVADDEDLEEVEPDQIADEIHRLSESDFEEVEHTQIGANPTAESDFESHVFTTEPAASAELERSLEAQLAEAEAEADAESFGFGDPITVPPSSADFALPLEEDEEEIAEIDEFEILAEADADDADLLTADGEAESHDRAAAYPEAYPAPPADLDNPPNEFEREPVVYAARAYADPISESSPVHDPEPRLSDSDFASRLELSDEFEAAPEADLEADPARLPSRSEASFSELDPNLGEIDPRVLSAGHALAAFDEDPDSQFTIAGALSDDPLDFDAPHSEPRPATYARAEPLPTGFPPLHAFDQSDVISADRVPPRGPAYPEPDELRAAPPSASDGYDLETALEALDVDLDDLAMPHAKTELPASTLPPRHAASRPFRNGPPRATTDDGILIDFDDPDDD